MQLLLPSIVFASYLLAAIMFVRVDRKQKNPLLALVIMVIACQLHAVSLIFMVRSLESDTINLSIFNIISIYGWSLACFSLFWLWRISMALPGALICAAVAILAMLPIFFVSDKPFIGDIEIGMLWHIASSIAAWTVLTIATLHALLYAWAYHRLKNKQIKKNNALSLAAIERIIIFMTTFGFLLLGFALFTGWLFVDDLFAQHLWQKTVLTMLSWLFYAFSLFMFFVQLQRGLPILYLQLAAYILLLSGYVLSNIIIQFIVN